MRYERLPEWLNPHVAAAQSLTRVVRQMDPKLVCAFNGKLQRYEIWGPSREQGWALIKAVENPFTGEPCSPEMYPSFILADLRRRDAPLDVMQLAEENARAIEREWLSWMDECGEAAQWIGNAVAQEASGAAVRYGVDDIRAGLRNILAGRSRGPAVGQKIFLPGVSPYGD